MDKDELRVTAQKLEGKRFKLIPQEKDLLQAYESKAEPGCYEIIIRKARKPKSQSQLGAHFGLMIERILAFCDDNGWDTSYFLKEAQQHDAPTGIRPTKDFLKWFFYSTCPILRDGKQITLSGSTTAEASHHLTECMNMAAKMGIHIPDPNPNWKLTDCTKDTQKE